MLLIVAGAMRTGSNVCYQVAQELVLYYAEGRAPIRRDTYTDVQVAQWAAEPGWVLMKSHYCTEQLKPYVLSKSAAVLMTVRDPYDIFVSLLHWNGKSITENIGVLGKTLHGSLEWLELTPSTNIFMLTYLAIEQRLSHVSSVIAQWLGLELPQSVHDGIAAKFSRDANVQRATHEEDTFVHSPEFMAKRHIRPVHTDWRSELSLTPEEMQTLQQLTTRYRRVFGYYATSN